MIIVSFDFFISRNDMHNTEAPETASISDGAIDNRGGFDRYDIDVTNYLGVLSSTVS